MPMDYKIEQLANRRAVFTLSGRLDASNASGFKDALKSAANDASIIVVDLTRLTFIDSSGLSALVSGFKALRERDGSLALTGVGDQVRVALELTKLDRIFAIHPDIASALASLGR